jgi:hypothetical protein
MKSVTVDNYKKDKFYGSIVKAVKELLMEKNEITPQSMAVSLEISEL